MRWLRQFLHCLVPSSRSKPTAFQAVRFQPTARWWGGPPGPRGSPRTRFRTASQRPRRGKTTKRPTWASAPISGGGLGVRPTTNQALTSGSGGFSRNPTFSRNPNHRLIGGGCLVQLSPRHTAPLRHRQRSDPLHDRVELPSYSEHSQRQILPADYGPTRRGILPARSIDILHLRCKTVSCLAWRAFSPGWDPRGISLIFRQHAEAPRSPLAFLRASVAHRVDRCGKHQTTSWDRLMQRPVKVGEMQLGGQLRK